MASTVVLASIENTEGNLCVDIFARADGTFGFEEYRRDPEDQRWSKVGYNSHRVFASQGEAQAAARAAVEWMQRTGS